MTVNVLWLFVAVPWVGLQWLMAVFPGDTHLQFVNTTFALFYSAYRNSVNNAFWRLNFYASLEGIMNYIYENLKTPPNLFVCLVLNDASTLVGH